MYLVISKLLPYSLPWSFTDCSAVVPVRATKACGGSGGSAPLYLNTRSEYLTNAYHLLIYTKKYIKT
jgi:hypothetical protein